MKPLEGVKVIEFTQVLSGPYCGMLLADMGADVIKLERPPLGDSSRYNTPGINGYTAAYSMRNRGKKSVLMDLSNPRQKEFFFHLIKDADIFLENFKPGTLEKLGCGYDVLKEINPGLILTSISGFGQFGPMSKKAAYDTLIQAESGSISLTGTKSGEITVTAYSMADVLAGITACAATLAALRGREITGEGQHVDIAMLDTMISAMETPYIGYMMNGEIPKPNGIAHPLAAPFTTYETKDGKSLLICISTNEQWEKLCDVLGYEEGKTDPRFQGTGLRKANEEAINQYVGAAVAQFNEAELSTALEHARLPFGHVNKISDVVDSEQFKARNMRVHIHYPDTEQTVDALGSAIKFSKVPFDMDYEAHTLGYDTLGLCADYMGQEAAHDIYDLVLEESRMAAKERMEKAKIL